MAPIRVGIIGLSPNAITSWASAAHLPYLLACNGKYEIRALCNSSVESAQAAIDTYKLPPSTRAYGNPQDLADDPNVDLVVCATRVDNHYRTTKPSIEAGKSVFVEWPLAANFEEATELATLAKEKGVRNMIGLQGRVSPIFLKVKAILQEDKIGKVLSSSIVASGGTNSHDSIGEGLKYFFDRRVGGNFLTIHFGHSIDSIHSVLGPFGGTESSLSLLRPNIKVLSSSKEVIEVVTSNVPDHIVYTGSLLNFDDAPISITLRRGPPFKGTPGIVWSILGETGEIRVEGPGPALQASDEGTKILVGSFETSEVQELDWEYEGKSFGGPAKNVGALYEAFSNGDEGSYPDFGDAVALHGEVDALWQEWDAHRISDDGFSLDDISNHAH